MTKLAGSVEEAEPSLRFASRTTAPKVLDLHTMLAIRAAWALNWSAAGKHLNCYLLALCRHDTDHHRQYGGSAARMWLISNAWHFVFEN